MRFEQKLLNLNTTPTGRSKRKSVRTDSQAANPSVDASVGEQEERPEGVKTAKAKRSNGKGKSVADNAEVWDMRDQELGKKEKLSKLAILDTLLAKSQPLSEAEEVAKNKLLAEFFS